MVRTTAIFTLLLITLSISTSTASRTYEIPRADWIKFSVSTAWAQEVVATVTEGFQSVIQWYSEWVDCVSNNRQIGLPLLESVVDFSKALVRCVGTIQDTGKRCSSPVQPPQEFSLVVVEVAPPKPKRAKPLKKKSMKPERAVQTELPIVLPPPPLRTVIVDLPRVLSQLESSALRRGTRNEDHVATENPTRIPPVLPYIAIWLSLIYVVALITDAVSVVRRLAAVRSEWLKNEKEETKETNETKRGHEKEKECKDNYEDRRLELLNQAASRIQATWRAYHSTAKKRAELLRQHSQFSNIILLQRLYHVEEDAARTELQAMTKERRRIVTKIQDYEKLSASKLREIVVQDDGNCMYYALSICKFGTPEHHNDLRQEITTWLANNSEFQIEEGLALCLLEGSWDNFVKAMRNDKEYGTVTCLYAASEIFGATIRIFNSTSDDMTIVPRSCKTTDTFWLTFAQKHYNPLVVDPTKISVIVPESLPSDMKECTFCTRWFDSPLTTCPRCDTPSSS